MNPLEALLRPTVRALNDTIAETTPARELCRELAGTTATVRLRGTAIAMTFEVGTDGLALVPGAADDPDIAITGALPDFVRVLGGAEEDAIRDGSLELLGDAERAAAFRRLLRYARPDAEERLARVVGDTAASAAGRLARRIGRWARGARETMTENTREYLQEERHVVPTRYEVDDFGGDVDRLRDDVDRLAARIERLEGGA